MTDYSNNTNKYIENKIGLNLKTLNSFSIGEHKKYSDIYSLTSHEYRYSALSTVLKIMAIPIIAVSNVIKILSCEILAVKEMVNIPAIMLKKMDQGISKKILQGLQDISEGEIKEITVNILQQWKGDECLIPRAEENLLTKIKNYVCDNIVFIDRIRKFWFSGGITYSEEQLKEQHLVKQITNEIFKLGYMVGKKGGVLKKEDIYDYFEEVGAYKDNTPTKKMDLVQNHWFGNNYDTWDINYLNDEDTTNLLGDDTEIH